LGTVTLLLLILAVFTALIIAVFQYLYKNKNEGQLKYWLSFFRFLSVFLILILLINPSIKKNNIEIVKPNLLVAVDNSSSIKYNHNNNQINKVIETLKEDVELNNKFSIKYFGFGDNLEVLDSLNFSKNQTNLALPLQEFSKINSNHISPVVLISDGNQTVGNKLEFVNYKNPVFSVIVGDTTVLEDIFINRINVNKNTILNNKFPVEFFINYSGENLVSKRFTIYHKGKNVFSKRLKFSKEKSIHVESVYLKSSNKGSQYFKAVIEELDEEHNTLNNTKSFSINVIDEKTKILVLSEIIHPDLGMLKKSVESDKSRFIDIFNNKDFTGNFKDYQLIVLYQPSKEFESAFVEINRRKLNYFIISGRSTNWDFLNDSQSIFKKEAIHQFENYQPVFNTSYASFLSNDIGFDQFSPLEDVFGDVKFSLPYNSLLQQKIGNISTQNPMLATFEDDEQRGAILFGENTWRWRMNSFNSTKSFEKFDAFMANLFQYLSSKKNNNRLSVSMEPMFYVNENIKISASYLDNNFKIDPRATLWVSISNKENNYFNKIPFAQFNNKFSIEVSNITAGAYNYVVSVENQDPKVSGVFKVLPFEVEQQAVNSNDTDLKLIASKTNGKIYYLNNNSIKLLDDIKSDSRFKSVYKNTNISTPLINWKWILGFIVLMFSIEWFTRKYFGKI